MSPDRYAKLKAIFEQAVEQPEEHRLEFVRVACAGDEELEAEVLRALAADEISSTPLDKPQHLTPLAPGEFPKGYRLGAYEILGRIGSGGMGTVYQAARSDNAFERLVAIKVSKLGVASMALNERLVVERKTLADLDHPNIARLLDGGTSPSAHPYYVMEYVPGTIITKYCTIHELDVTGRLRLFAEVCSAVAYAHRKLIVHRDLKPGNIMVRTDGVVKLLDFGLAKLLDSAQQSFYSAPRLSAGESHPGLKRSLPAFTPEYASPEQLQGKDVSTATDVYSLGVLLHELLTGFRPPKLRSRGRGGIADLIYEKKHLRPSVLVGLLRRQPNETLIQAIWGVPPALVAKLRDQTTDTLIQSIWHVPPDWQKIATALRGDLDFIILKALRVNPEDRYSSGADLENDIHRYLNKQPVRARKPTILYWTSRFALRNARVLSGGVLAGLVIGGMFLNRVLQERKTSLVADRSSYISGMIAADEQLRAGDSIAARQSLLRIPLPYRSWEWNYLYNTLDTSVKTLSAATGESGIRRKNEIGADIKSSLVSWNNGTTVNVWNDETFQPERRAIDFGHIYGLSPSGRLLLASESKRDMYASNRFPILFDARSGHQTTKVAISLNQLQLVGFDEERDRMATADRDGTIQIWRCGDGALIKVIRGDGHSLSTLIFVPNSNTLLAQTSDTSQIRILDCASGSTARIINDVPRRPASVSMDVSGRRLALAVLGTVIIIDIHDGHRLREVSLPGEVTATTFGLDGNLYVGMGDGKILVIDTQTQTVLRTLAGHVHAVTALHYNSGRNRLISADGEQLKIWDLGLDGAFRIAADSEAMITALAVDPDGTLIAGSSVELVKPSTNGKRAYGRYWVSLYDSSGKFLRMISAPAESHCLRFSNDGRHLAVANVSGGVQVFSTSTGELEYDVSVPQPAKQLTFSSNGKYLAILSGRGAVQVYDLYTSQFHWPAETVLACAVRFVNNDHIAAIGDRLRVWSLHDLAQRRGLTINGWAEEEPALNIDIGNEPFQAGLSGCGDYGRGIMSISQSGRIVSATWQGRELTPVITTGRIQKSFPEFINSSPSFRWPELLIDAGGERFTLLSSRIDLSRSWRDGTSNGRRWDVGIPEVWDIPSGQRLLTVHLLVGQIASSRNGGLLAVSKGGKLLFWSSKDK